MNRVRNPVAATFFTFWSTLAAAQGSPEALEELMAELAQPDLQNWEGVENRIVDLWSRSGSRSMDLLLERGREAMEAEDYATALDHFSALTDHAPDFAEGWNMRATVFFLMERHELAIADLGRALSLNPEHFGALNGLGVLLEQLGEEKDALRAYRAAFALNPHRENLTEAIERLAKRVDGTDI